MLIYGFSTFFAFMRDDIAIFVWFNRYWSHHATAIRHSVAGGVINVFRPKTFWAMVCITITKNVCATMGAGKIFNAFCKSFHL